jgi:hypothetical protein
MKSKARSEAARRNQIKAAEANRKPKVAKQCEACGAEMLLPPSWAHQRFCSRVCRYTAMRGDNAPNSGGGDKIKGKANPRWKGGRGKDRQARHHQAEVGRWRRRVFHRDKYTCQRCGDDRGGNLRGHHISTWATDPSRRFDVDNGVTLCHTCHNWVHSPRNVDHDFLV